MIWQLIARKVRMCNLNHLEQNLFVNRTTFLSLEPLQSDPPRITSGEDFKRIKVAERDSITPMSRSIVTDRQLSVTNRTHFYVEYAICKLSKYMHFYKNIKSVSSEILQTCVETF